MEEKAVLTKKITKTALAKKLGLSRQSLYYPKKQPLLDEEVKRQIEAILSDHPVYGHKRIALELKLNKKRILRVMKKFGIKPYRQHARVLRKKEDEGKAAVENAINIYKLLCPIRPNVVWVSDFTYIKYQGRFIYMATAMDRSPDYPHVAPKQNRFLILLIFILKLKFWQSIKINNLLSCE